MIVTKLDGTTEAVKVMQLPIRSMGDYLAAIDDESKLVELAANKEAGWSDSLTEESFEAVIIKMEELNADFFFRWLNRRAKRMAGLAAFLPQGTSVTSPTGSLK